MIHWELYKKLKFDHVNTWYIHNLESALKNETHKILWNFDIHTDHQISARQSDLVIFSKKTENMPNCRFCRPGRPQSKIEGRRKER